MKILVACEFSGIVRDAFAAKGHDAWSCDLLPTERPGNHIQGDVLDILEGIPTGLYGGVEFCDLSSADKEAANQGIIEEDVEPWDLMIAHPPCTHLAVSGARWFKDKRDEQAESLRFVEILMAAPIPKICIENPISIISSRIRKPDQIIQPWQFGHGETKATCLWLKGLPPLQPTNIVEGRENRVHRCPPGPERWKIRSRTLTGIANAMADQWK